MRCVASVITPGPFFFLLMFLFILPSVGLYAFSHHALYDVIFTVTWIAVGRIGGSHAYTF